MDVLAHLTRMCEAHGPSGYEGPVRDVIKEEWSPLTESLTVDPLGNLIGVKSGSQEGESRCRIMLAAHMDEIGMLVRDIEGPFIRVRNLGGIDPRVMLAQAVIVHGKETLPGVVAAAPPHLLPAAKRKKYPTVDELIIDVGLSSEEVQDLVSIGDMVTVDAPVIELVNGRVAGKVMDDRACVAAITVCLDELQRRDHHWDVIAVATVQEEVGVRGATTSAYGVNPDAAIALDVTFATQMGVSEDDGFKLGCGPVLGIGPNFHVKLLSSIQDAAKRLEMDTVIDPMPGRSGTDAWAIQVAQQGIPTALMSVALRNMHSPIEMLELADITRAGRLLAEFIADLDADYLATIAYDNPLTDDDTEAEEA